MTIKKHPSPKAVKKTAKHKPPPQSLKAATKPADPEQRRPFLFLSPSSTAGMRVSESTALTLATVWACIKVITEDLAGMPWRVLESRADGGSTGRPEDPSDWLLHTQSNPETPAFQWREAIVAHALSWGNGYAEIERDIAGRPAWLWQLTPDRVQPERFRGRIIYDVHNTSGPNTALEQEDMYHLKGLGFDGLVGYSPIRMLARTIGMGIALEEAAATLFANDTTPGGILEHPTRLSQEARDNLAESWKRRHGGPQNRRVLAILEEGMKWSQTSLPPEDAQFIEQRQFTPAEICRIFRVHPPKIADLLRATFANIEELAIWHVTDTLLPWARRLETEANIKLFGRTNRGKRFTKLNFNALLRGNVAARGTFYQLMLDRGAFSINDVLQLEDRNPIGADGDKRFVPLNMQLLSKAGEEPPPQDPAPPIEPEPEEDNEPMLRKLESHSMSILTDACRRILKREQDAAHLEGDVREVWLVKHKQYCRYVLTPAVKLLAECFELNEDAAELAVGLYLANQVCNGADSSEIKAIELRSYLKAAAAAKEVA